VAKDKAPEPEADATAWMSSFADLLTNLLVFFVLLLSMKAVDDQKLQDSLTFFRGALGPLEMGSGTGVTTIKPVVRDEKGAPMYLDGNDMLQVYADIFESFNEGRGRLGRDQKGTDTIRIYEDHRGIHISLAGEAIFRPGSAELVDTPENDALLTRIALAVRGTPFDYEVGGHTDDAPVGTDSAFGSNWMLSTARASTLLEELRNRGAFDPSRVRVVGYGASRPVASNDTPEGRRLNRRTELVLVQPED